MGLLDAIHKLFDRRDRKSGKRYSAPIMGKMRRGGRTKRGTQRGRASLGVNAQLLRGNRVMGVLFRHLEKMGVDIELTLVGQGDHMAIEIRSAQKMTLDGRNAGGSLIHRIPLAGRRWLAQGKDWREAKMVHTAMRVLRSEALSRPHVLIAS